MYWDPTGHISIAWPLGSSISLPALGIGLGTGFLGALTLFMLPEQTCVTTKQEATELAKYDAARKNTPISYYPPTSSTSSAPTGKTPTVGSATQNKPSQTWTANVTVKPAIDGKYIVKWQDTIEVIAKANKTTVDALLKANPNITDKNKIQVGQTIKMPSNGGSPSPNNNNNKPKIGKEITKLITKEIVKEVGKEVVKDLSGRESNAQSLNPSKINFTQSSIKNQTGDYTVLENADALKNGTLQASDLPTIKVFKGDDGEIWSLDNRRLASFKLAGIDNVPVQWATPEEIESQGWKMTTQTGGASIKLKMGDGTSIIIK